MTWPIPHDISNFGNYCVLKLSLQWKHYHCVWLLLIQLFRCNIQHWKDNFLRSHGHFHILPLLQHAWGISQILQRRQGAQSLKNSGASKMSVKETRKNLLTWLLPRLSQGEPVDCCCQSLQLLQPKYSDCSFSSGNNYYEYFVDCNSIAIEAILMQ